MKSLDQFGPLEVPEKVRNVFEPVSVLPQHHISSIKFFLFCSYFVLSKLLEFKEFNKTIIPFVLVGYQTGYSQLGASRLVGYLPSHIQCALME